MYDVYQWPVPGLTRVSGAWSRLPGPDHRDIRAETRIETVSCRQPAATATGISRDHQH